MKISQMKSIIIALLISQCSFAAIVALDSPYKNKPSNFATTTPVQTTAVDKLTENRLIGYLPGWKTPPSVKALSKAGYTHIIIAFGIFNTKNPGAIFPAFDTVKKDYIRKLQKAGIKVLLSLGGPITSIPHTSVNFHRVLGLADSPLLFEKTFLKSLEHLVNTYGFDGFDVDIEEGIRVTGTMAKPTGDIQVLANIINTAYSKHPDWLFSLAPQVENISANPAFDDTWGSYASLIMQTHDALSWVGIQLYNSGCAYGIDKFCYEPKKINSPDFSVAMAVDLLTDWPLKTSTGDVTGFQPYISYLKPSQVVLGYFATTKSRLVSWPTTPVSTIKRAVQCLRTATVSNYSCDKYVPPHAYQEIGGVFGWEVNFDQENDFKFAMGLNHCVLHGRCEE